ncbi:MAG: hypothetical protein K6E11_04580 [Bacilli bacterium]|nr:hypothetical protein [Bacilli bacterium]
MKQVKCPNCGASMEIQDNRNFAFCSYCGTKIIVNEVVQINRENEINNLLNRAYEYELKHDYAKARDYCNKVLDIDSNNEFARALEKRLDSASPINNVIIKYNSLINEKFKLRITLDGITWHTIEPNGEISLCLPIGSHFILFAGRKKTYRKKIDVLDSKKTITITYIAKSWHSNEIKVE